MKLLGRTAGYNYLIRCIKALWHPKSHIELVALDNDYFIVKFAFTEDYNFAKYEGPLIILDHYLVVKEWMRSNFDPFTDTTEKVLVWICFPSLPIEYYNRRFLMRRPIKNDQATNFANRGKFVCMCGSGFCKTI